MKFINISKNKKVLPGCPDGRKVRTSATRSYRGLQDESGTRNGPQRKKIMENMFNVIDTLFNPFIANYSAAAKNAAVQSTLPMNIYKEEDGTNVIELAIPGKTKEDIKLSKKTENGVDYLVFDLDEKEQTENEEEKKEDKREWFLKKIKVTKHCSLSVPNTLDINSLKATVENGLLTVRIPVAEEAKPVVFAIE